MFQLWKFILLCGLLSRTSAALLKDAVSNLLQGGLQDVDNPLESVLQKLRSELNELQESAALQLAPNSQDLVNDLVSAEQKLLKIKINQLSVLNIKDDMSSDGPGINLRIPISANVTATLPFIGKLADLQVTADLLTRIKFETDARTGLRTTVVGECSIDAANISLSLLDRQSLLANRILDMVSDVLKRTVSLLLQNQVCPLIQALQYSSALNLDLLWPLISNVKDAANVSPNV